MGQRKCQLCGKPITKDQYDHMVDYKGSKVHENCFKLSLQVLKKEADSNLKDAVEEAAKKKKIKPKSTPKPKAELKGPVSEEEYQEKKAFFEYLKTFIETDNGYLPAKIYALTDRYIDQYGFTYKTLQETMIYIRELSGKEVSGDCMGLLPYYKEEAEKYYQSLKEVEENNKDKDVSKMYKEKLIVIGAHKPKVKQLDITSIT